MLVLTSWPFWPIALWVMDLNPSQILNAILDDNKFIR